MGEYPAAAGFEVAPVLLDVVRRLQQATVETLPDQLRYAVETGARLVGAERSFLRVFEPDGREIMERHAWSVDGKTDDRLVDGDPQKARRVFQWSSAQFIAGEPVAMNRIEDLPEEAAGERAFFEERGVRSWLSIPVRAGRRTLAYQSFETLSFEKTWSQGEIDTMRLLAGVLATAITSHRAVIQRKESEARFRRIFAGHPDAMVIVRLRDLIITECNDEWVRANLLPDRDAALGRSMAEFVYGFATPSDLATLRDQADSPLPVHREITAPLDGVERTVSVLMSGIETAEEPSILISVRDVTERKRLEQHVRRAQKSEAIGLLAGGIAHDFNNLLTIITGYSESLIDQLNGDVQDEARWIRDAAEQSARLTRKLLILGRHDLGEAREYEPLAFVRELVPMFRSTVGEAVRFDLQLDPAGVVRVDRGQLEQALLNLVLNASEAVREAGSRIALRTSILDFSGAAPAGAPPLPPARYACIEVADDGPGVCGVPIERVTEPFYTTKARGTGLGLSIVEGIAQRYGGALWLASEPEQGMRARLLLPLLDTNSATAFVDAEIPGLGQMSPQHVLLVEDEPALRRLARRQLESSGHKVTEAGDGEEALAIARALPAAFDVVVTDVVMPRMGGLALLDALRTEGFDAPFVVVSGYPNLEPGDGPRTLPETAVFLQKPYAADDLREAIAEALGLSSEA